MLIKPMYDDQNAPRCTGDRNPRPAEEGVVSTAEEQEGRRTVGAVPVSGAIALGQRSPPESVLLLSLPRRLPLLRRRRVEERFRYSPAATTGEDEEEQGEKEGMDEEKNRP